MSNYRAIGAVTATLRSMMQQVVNSAAPGATVTIKRPAARDDAQKDLPGLNIFLYRTSPNPAFRNLDTPTRDHRGRLIARPTSGIDLDYLFTFYGPGVTPHALLGRTLTALHAEPYLSPTRIRGAIDDATNADERRLLEGADLADQMERVRIEQIPLALEELSKLWSVFLQVPYDLSVAYRVSVVLIAADLVPQAPLPVRGRGVGSGMGAPAQLDQVIPFQVDPRRDSHVRLRGRNLAGEQTRVQFAALAPNPPDEIAAGGELLAAVPAALPAGVRSVRVWQDFPLPQGSRSIGSNEIPVVIRPALVAPVEVAHAGDTTTLTLLLERALQPGQSGSVLLNPCDTNSSSALVVDFRVDQPSSRLEVTLDGARVAGAYLVRIRVDGAESLLEVDDTTGLYSGPKIQLA